MDFVFGVMGAGFGTLFVLGVRYLWGEFIRTHKR